MASKVEIITPEKLASMHTGTLMSRRATLLKCEETCGQANRVEFDNNSVVSETGIIEFKDTPEWQSAYQELKDVLGTRENLPNKEERKEIRKAKAKQSR